MVKVHKNSRAPKINAAAMQPLPPPPQPPSPTAGPVRTPPLQVPLATFKVKTASEIAADKDAVRLNVEEHLESLADLQTMITKARESRAKIDAKNEAMEAKVARLEVEYKQQLDIQAEVKRNAKSVLQLVRPSLEKMDMECAQEEENLNMHKVSLAVRMQTEQCGGGGGSNAIARYSDFVHSRSKRLLSMYKIREHYRNSAKKVVDIALADNDEQ